jgi:hypothetical protein
MTPTLALLYLKARVGTSYIKEISMHKPWGMALAVLVVLIAPLINLVAAEEKAKSPSSLAPSLLISYTNRGDHFNHIDISNESKWTAEIPQGKILRFTDTWGFSDSLFINETTPPKGSRWAVSFTNPSLLTPTTAKSGYFAFHKGDDKPVKVIYNVPGWTAKKKGRTWLYYIIYAKIDGVEKAWTGSYLLTVK